MRGYSLVQTIVHINRQGIGSLYLAESLNFIRTFKTTLKKHHYTSKKMMSRNIVPIKTQSVNAKESPEISVAQGRLRGSVEQLYNGTPYYSFKGIPYAEPPVGKLRFKSPQPPKPWTGVLEAVEHGKVCPQVEMFSGRFLEGSEDCLFLNIYTSSLQTKKPVMVFIHGGAFVSGSGDSELFGPHYLLEKDVVLVTINYRLEVLGFLCLDTEEVPGNAGMRDQVAALKWVQENISQFGGDPNNVTLFGESAGSVSVNHHVLSPLSRGLFHKAIMQSGVALNDWAIGQDGKERAIRAAKVLGKDITDPNELLSFFQTVPAKDLVLMTFKTVTMDEKHRCLPIHFCPVVEKTFDNVKPFLNDTPLNIVLQNKVANVPMMIGYNTSEGIMFIRLFLKKLDFILKNFQYKVPRELAQKVSESVQKEFGERIREFYFGDKDISKDTQAIISLESDFHFVYGVHRLAHFVSQHNNSTYLYTFNTQSDLNIMKNVIMGVPEVAGASHVDELFYLFSTNMTADTYRGQEDARQKVDVMTKLWTDFAKTGNPTPDDSLGVKWRPYSQSGGEYLSIDDKLTAGKFANRERVEFWNKLYGEAGLPCITKSHL
ncbi:esterase E4 isoform X1 [Plutella xylostella]|uniref:esterase E4 isoform X1 n=2 Tax=Plutella xylostella TaxID=51655 RepID=UPI002032B2BA|nr:esterase E4 isoform X1 [Plutella xylostella]